MLGTLYKIIEINTVNSRITRIKYFVGLLKIHPHPLLVDLLTHEGFDINENDLESGLQRALNLLCQDELKVSQLQQELEAAQAISDDGEKITSAYFDDVILSYGDVFKVSMNRKDLTTQTYCRMVKKLKEYAEKQTSSDNSY